MTAARLPIIMIIMLAVPSPALAAGERIPAAVVSVYDGDTLTVLAHPWPGIAIETGVRLRGIDTPELRARCERERRLAVAARDRLAELVGDRVVLEDVERGKYAGRVVADVILPDGRSAAAVLLAEGIGRPYDGRSRREGWCGG